MWGFPPHMIQIFQSLDLCQFGHIQEEQVIEVPLRQEQDYQAHSECFRSLNRQPIENHARNQFKVLLIELYTPFVPDITPFREEKFHQSRPVHEIRKLSTEWTLELIQRNESRWIWPNQWSRISQHCPCFLIRDLEMFEWQFSLHIGCETRVLSGCDSSVAEHQTQHPDATGSIPIAVKNLCVTRKRSSTGQCASRERAGQSSKCLIKPYETRFLILYLVEILFFIRSVRLCDLSDERFVYELRFQIFEVENTGSSRLQSCSQWGAIKPFAILQPKSLKFHCRRNRSTTSLLAGSTNRSNEYAVVDRARNGTVQGYS